MKESSPSLFEGRFPLIPGCCKCRPVLVANLVATPFLLKAVAVYTTEEAEINEINGMEWNSGGNNGTARKIGVRFP